MELEILHLIQGLHIDWLDTVMIFLTKLGDKGIIWIALSIVLAIIPKTRRCGLTMMAAMLLSDIVGNKILKPIVARPRPCTVDTGVAMLITSPTSYSFPSGHTMNGFTAAASLFVYYKKPGTAAFILAALIAFSRMYLFVHYPTDILAGVILGLVDTWVVWKLAQKLAQHTPLTKSR